MEYTWNQFRTLDHIRNLPVNEQVKRYRFYLEELSSMINIQNKGRAIRPTATTPFSGFLLQENFDYILQEDGSKIYL
jgi:hypothetical protein